MIYDVLVIGAGPGGSSAARELAKSGLSVAIADKQKFPREKLCGNLVSGFCQRHIGVDLPRDIVRGDATVCRVNYKYATTMTFEEPAGSFVKRKQLDHFLLTRAIDAGAEYLPHHRATKIEEVADGVLATTFADGKMLESRYVIGADGVRGCSSRFVRNGRFRKWKYGVAYVVEVPKSAIDTTRFPDLYLDAAFIPGGYAWVFVEGEVANIGAGSSLLFNRFIRKRFAEFLEYCVTDKTVLKDIKAGGHLLPIGGFGRRITKSSVLLVGDAAGAVDSVSGEGIGFAVVSGKLAGQAIASNKDNPDAAMKAYNRTFKKTIMSQLRPMLFYSVLLLVFRPVFFFLRPRRSIKLFSLQVEAVAGRISHRAFAFKALRMLPGLLVKNLWDIIRRAPVQPDE
jgi:geranylgeranyl reductase family protein